MTEKAEITGSIASRDGLLLFYRKFEADKPKGAVVFAHGLGEHSGRYQHLAESVLSLDLSFWAIDHRGHGHSAGSRGHVLSFDQYLMDLHQLVEMARKDLPKGAKLYLIGHSMGGLIAANFVLKFQGVVDGVVLSSPALGMKVEVPAWKDTMGKLMSSFWPGLTMQNELPTDKISHDEEVVRDYLNDPLVHTKVSSRWFTEFLQAISTAQNNAPKLDIPVLMQVAGDDYLVNAPSSKDFFGKLTTNDKTLHYYEGLYHEVYHELGDDRTKVLTDLKQWLKGRIS